MTRAKGRWSEVLLSYCPDISDLLFGSVAEKGAVKLAPAMGVPVHFLLQLFQVEDKRFIVHPGVDPIAVLRAATANGTSTGVIQGASTITQQLYNVQRMAKRKARHRGPTYKVGQTAWALAKERHSSKREILSEYLDTIYWGRLYYGIDAAASGYFRTDRDKITVAQGFFLAERLASPNMLSIGRVQTLLQRASIAEMFAQDANARGELTDIYEEHFRCGDGLRQLLLT